MDFIWDIQKMFKTTENGALTHATSGQGLVDFYFRAIDGIDTKDLELLLESAWREDPRGAVVLIFDLSSFLPTFG